MQRRIPAINRSQFNRTGSSFLDIDVSSNRGRETGEACFLGGIGGAQKRERRSLNNYFQRDDKRLLRRRLVASDPAACVRRASMSHLSSESITTAFLVSSRTGAWPLLSFNGHPRRISVSTSFLSITPVSLLFTSSPRRASKTCQDRLKNDPNREKRLLTDLRFPQCIFAFSKFQLKILKRKGSFQVGYFCDFCEERVCNFVLIQYFVSFEVKK